MSNFRLYVIWRERVKQLLPENCKTRLTNMAYLLVGMYQASSVHLSMIARKLPIRAQKLSIERRLRRFLANEAVDVRSWYHPWAAWLVAAASSGGQVNLIVDTTKVTSRFRKLSIAIAYRRRAVPLIWDWVPHARGHCTVQQQIQLLRDVKALLPADVKVSLVGDGEFGNPLVIECLDYWGWDYALRQACDTLIYTRGSQGWVRLDALGLQPGHQLWIGRVVLTQASSYPTNIVAYWKAGEKGPLFLATNQLEPGTTRRLYRRRMWIEEMFGDMKGHGFDLERSRLATPDRLSRLTLAVCILYIWLITLGEHVISHGLQSDVDRADRRDLSIFRLGWDWLERRLALNDPLPDCFRPTFCSVSGS